MNFKYINRSEALRFMKYGGEPTGEFLKLLETCEREVASAASPAFTYKVFETSEAQAFLEGKDVRCHLEGCDRVILLGATLGIGIDRYISRLQVTDITCAMIADAVASAFIEEYCKEVDALLSKEFEPSFLTWRFSPGYGDYPIEYQKEILRVIEAQKRIGLHLTDSFMLLPVKSVTAVIGVSKTPVKKEKQNCAVCNLRDTCTFRKEGEHCGNKGTVEQ